MHLAGSNVLSAYFVENKIFPSKGWWFPSEEQSVQCITLLSWPSFVSVTELLMEGIATVFVRPLVQILIESLLLFSAVGM